MYLFVYLQNLEDFTWPDNILEMDSVTTVYQWYWSQCGEREIEKCPVSYNKMFQSHLELETAELSSLCGVRSSLKDAGQVWHLIRPHQSSLRWRRVSICHWENCRPEQQWSVISVRGAGSEGSNETGTGKLGTMPSLTLSNADSL